MEPQPNKIAELISEAINILGPNGEHWIRGRLDDGCGNYCMLGALSKANQKIPDSNLFTACESVARVIERKSYINCDGDVSCIPIYNDIVASNFSQIKEVMCQAVNNEFKEQHEREDNK